MRFTLKQLLIAVALFGSLAGLAYTFGFTSAEPSNETAGITWLISGMAFGGAIGSLTRRPFRFGIIGAVIGPFVVLAATWVLFFLGLALGFISLGG
jgi:hypothetical protein